jgi:signal-transduction protein with cAMP-binding, CBS, and nucleotidyltransferase domain
VKCPSCGVDNLQGADVCDGCGHDMSAVAPKPRGLSKRILEGTISDLHPRDAITVGPEKTVPDVVRLMREKGMGCVLVVESEDIRGIMTERDLLFGVAGVEKAENVELSELMHRDPVCLKEDDPVSYAFHHMSVGGFRHLPIKRANGSIGMISARDLLRYLSST